MEGCHVRQPKETASALFPIFFEILFSILAGAVDTLLLSSEGDQAVGAVDTANTYISIFVIMFSIISSGMVAVMTQYIGAKRPGVARQALRLGVCFNLAAGVVISGFLFFCAEPILQTLGIAVVFAFLCAAGGTWLFGVRLGWLAVGAYVGMALDECVRAVFIYLRWRKGCWKTTSLVRAKS